MLRRINRILVILLLVAFLDHIVMASTRLFGATFEYVHIAGYITFILIAIHAIIGIVLTISTLLKIHKSHASYIKGNERFWANRISGFLMLFLMVYHVYAFEAGRYDVLTLILMILFVLSLHAHIITNIKPFAMSFGLERMNKVYKVIMIVSSLLILFLLVGFIVYFFIR